MSDIDLESATESELIVAAQEAICSTDDPVKQRQVQDAIETIAKEVREAYSQEQDDPGRAVLAERLGRVRSLSGELRRLLEDPHVNEALHYGWATLDDGVFDFAEAAIAALRAHREALLPFVEPTGFYVAVLALERGPNVFDGDGVRRERREVDLTY